MKGTRFQLRYVTYISHTVAPVFLAEEGFVFQENALIFQAISDFKIII